MEFNSSLKVWVMRFGIGLLGAGFMGKAHSHAYKSITTYVGTEVIPKLVAIYSRSEERARDAMKKYGYERFYTDWRKLIKDDEIEIVDNSLPNFLHKEPSIEAIELGKHVVCEKPLARNLEEALEMVKVAIKSKVTHGVIFNKRWFPSVQLARKLLKEGILGEIIGFRFAYHQDWALSSDASLWRFKRDLAGYGVLGDQGSHVIDLIHFLIGRIKRVSAKAKKLVKRADVEDYIIVLAETKGSAIGTVEVSRISPGRKNYLVFEIYGNEGSIYFNMERLNELWVYVRDAPEMSGFRRVLVTEASHPFYKYFWPAGHTIGWAESFVLQLYHFLRAIKRDEEFRPNFIDGAAVNAVMDSIYKSLEENKWIEVKYP